MASGFLLPMQYDLGFIATSSVELKYDFVLSLGLQPHRPRATSERAVASFLDWLKMLPIVWDESRFATFELYFKLDRREKLSLDDGF